MRLIYHGLTAIFIFVILSEVIRASIFMAVLRSLNMSGLLEWILLRSVSGMFVEIFPKNLEKEVWEMRSTLLLVMCIFGFLDVAKATSYGGEIELCWKDGVSHKDVLEVINVLEDQPVGLDREAIMAQCYFQIGRYEKSIEFSTLAISYGKTLVGIRKIRGDARYLIGDFRGAIDDYRRALIDDGKKWDIIFGIFRSYEALGSFEKAEEVILGYIKDFDLSPTPASGVYSENLDAVDAYIELAEFYVRRNRYESAYSTLLNGHLANNASIKIFDYYVSFSAEHGFSGLADSHIDEGCRNIMLGSSKYCLVNQ